MQNSTVVAIGWIEPLLEDEEILAPSRSLRVQQNELAKDDGCEATW